MAEADSRKLPLGRPMASPPLLEKVAKDPASKRPLNAVPLSGVLVMILITPPMASLP